MKKDALQVMIWLLMCMPLMVFAQEENNVIGTNDLKLAIGNWEGMLTYVDYTSGEPFKMPANLKVEQGGNEYKLKFYNSYPNEPKANGSSQLIISKNGKLINGKTIVSRNTTEDGVVELIVEYLGKDGNQNKKAVIRLVYTLGKQVLMIRKEVKFQDNDVWLKRNEFAYKKQV